MEPQSTSSSAKGAVESYPQNIPRKESNTSLISNESSGFSLNEEVESAIDTKPTHSFSRKEVNKILASDDVRLLHMAIWLELGVLNEKSALPPLPVRHVAPVEVNEADETNLAKAECTKDKGKSASKTEMTQIRNRNRSGSSKVEAWIEKTVSHQLNNNNNNNNDSGMKKALDKAIPAFSTDASSQTGQEEVSFAQRWAYMVVCLYRHSEWRRKVEDLEMRDEHGEDTWEEMQELLDRFEEGLLEGV
ncbi:hypothetical protein ACMFMG_004498 [Clarireedia jacksonii]